MNGILNRQTVVILAIDQRTPTTYKVVEAINNRLFITFTSIKLGFKVVLKTLKSIDRSL
jgi:hypothetical protein